MLIKLLIEGGDMKPGPAIAQKLGPLGINICKVIQDVNLATKNFKGLKVPVELDVDAKSKKYEIKVASPPVSELIKKEIGVEKASGETKKLKAGNLAIEQVIKIAMTKLPNMLAKDLKSAVRSVIGSCVSLGILVEDKDPKEVEKEISQGKYDKEISSQSSEASPEKLKHLKEYFAGLRKKQEEVIKKEEEAKAAEEATKAAEAATKPQEAAATPEAGKTAAPVAGEAAPAPAVGAKTAGAKTAGAKAAEKPAKPRKTNN